MAYSMPTHGRTPRGGGTVKEAPRASGQQAPPAVIPLAQTPPPMRVQALPVSPVPAPQPRPGQGPNQLPQWRGGDNTNDALIFRSRAPQMSRGTEVAGRISSLPDPPSDGPIRPAMRLVNRTWNWTAGTGSSYTDDLTRPYTHLGEQGSGWTTVYGGAPGFYRQGPGGAPVGDPGQGTARVWAGPPHGLHTMYPPDRQQTQANYRARPQMVAPRVDRLSNSRIAGQNYSQWTRHQGGGQQ